MLTTNEPKWFMDILKMVIDHGYTLPPSSWQSQDVSANGDMAPIEVVGHTMRWAVHPGVDWAQQAFAPNLPWAEDHFQERVGGEPLNPPPSEQWWPFARRGNAEHKESEIFSHTYPERFWPKYAGNYPEDEGNGGIRYRYGDLLSVVDLLTRDILTRQAYLPVWFPEDTGAESGQRVPCTLGYHFMFRPDDKNPDQLKGLITYYMRSCDVLRHLKDDAYMAARLLQWIVGKLRENEINASPGVLMMHVSSLHIFRGDLPMASRAVAHHEEQDYGYGV